MPRGSPAFKHSGTGHTSFKKDQLVVRCRYFFILQLLVFLSERTIEYKGYLVNQGYSSKLVDDQFLKASTTSRNDSLRTRAKSKKKLFPFVTTFNPNLPDVGRISLENT